MRVIQERDGSNWPQVAYTRGLDLSGSFEGAGGIGGLLARSHDFTNCNNTITYWLTNDSGYCISNLSIYDDSGVYVDNVYIDAGETWSYSFPGVPGRTYYVHGDSCDYYYIQVFDDSFTGTLETHAVDFLGEEGKDSLISDSGNPLCDAESSGCWLTHSYYHADGNGNITCLIDTNQTVVASYRYDPFGNTLSKSGALADANVYRFSSKELHASSGMYYYGYRFYDPGLQRWVNRDPVGEAGFEAVRNPAVDPATDASAPGQEIMNPYQFTNPYQFVLNSPLVWVDVLGLMPDWWPDWLHWPRWLKKKWPPTCHFEGENWDCDISAGGSVKNPSGQCKIRIGWPFDKPLHPPKKGKPFPWKHDSGPVPDPQPKWPPPPSRPFP